MLSYLQIHPPQVIIEQIFLANQLHKSVVTRPESFALLIMKGRQRLRVLAGQDIARIIVPVSSHMLQYLMQTSLDFQTALVHFPGQLDQTLYLCLCILGYPAYN